MLLKDFVEIVKSAEEAKVLTYGYMGYTYISGVMRRASMYVVKLADSETKVVKIPKRAVNKWGNEVDVAGFMAGVFQDNEAITDIILHTGVHGVPDGAFRGCKNLKRITIPKGVRKIGKDVFAGCDSLEDVYYEGTKEEWEKIEIYQGKRVVELGDLVPGTPVCEVVTDYMKHDSGNDALLKANVHFGCVWDTDK